MVGRPWRRCAGGGKRRGRCVCGARRGDMAATEGPVREEGLQGPLLPRAQARPRGPLRLSGRAPPAASGPAPPSGSGRAPPAGSGHRRNTCSLRPSATAGTRAASGLRPPPCPVTSRCEEPRPGPASNRRHRSKPLPTAPPTQQLRDPPCCRSTPRPPQIDAEIHPAADPAGAAVAHATPSFGCRSSTRCRDRQQHAPRHQILEVVGVASRSRSGLHPES